MDILIFVFSIVQYFKNNKSWAWIGFFSLITNYFGYGEAESQFLFRHNISDLGLLFSIIVFIYEGQRRKWQVDSQVKKYIGFIFLYLILAIIIDIFFNYTSVWDVFRTTKTWLALLTFYSFSRLKNQEIKKIIYLIVVITIIQSVLYHIQYLSGIQLYSYRHSIYTLGSKEISRGGFPPYFAYFVFLILLTPLVVIRLSKFQKIAAISLLMGTVILSLTRSALFAFLLGGFIVLFMDRVSISTLVSSIVIILIGYLVVMNNEALNSRINDGLADISYTFSESKRNVDVNENFSYRIFHFMERYNYLSNSSQKTLFGLGFVHETSFKPKIFNIGLQAKDGSGVVQLDTADFAWTILIIRLGIIGTIVLCIPFFYFIRWFYFNRRDNLSKVTFIYLIISLFVLSFTSSEISNGYFWPFIFILFYYQYNLLNHHQSNGK